MCLGMAGQFRCSIFLRGGLVGGGHPSSALWLGRKQMEDRPTFLFSPSLCYMMVLVQQTFGTEKLHSRVRSDGI